MKKRQPIEIFRDLLRAGQDAVNLSHLCSNEEVTTNTAAPYIDKLVQNGYLEFRSKLFFKTTKRGNGKLFDIEQALEDLV